MKFHDIQSVTKTLDLPYPRNRLYGPLCHEVQTADKRFVVNLLYFPREFARIFADNINYRGLIRR